MTSRNTGRDRGVHQPIATVVGAVFLLGAILGFIPGATTDYDTMTFAGHASDAKLLGLFEVSVLHNLVHGLSGIAGLLLARRGSSARAYLIGGGVVYLVLWVYGLVIEYDSDANFVPLNDADNWLHLGLGLGMGALGLIPDRDDHRRSKDGPVGRGDHPEYRGGRDRPGAADRDRTGIGQAHGDSGRTSEDLPDRQRRRGRGRR